MLDVWLYALCWIGGLWIVRPIYEFSLGIDIQIGPSHQAGEELVTIGGYSEIILRDMPEHKLVGN